MISPFITKWSSLDWYLKDGVSAKCGLHLKALHEDSLATSDSYFVEEPRSLLDVDSFEFEHGLLAITKLWDCPRQFLV